MTRPPTGISTVSAGGPRSGAGGLILRLRLCLCATCRSCLRNNTADGYQVFYFFIRAGAGFSYPACFAYFLDSGVWAVIDDALGDRRTDSGERLKLFKTGSIYIY